MDWQQALALLIVLLTVGLFMRGWWRKRAARGACGLGCGCAAGGSVPPKESVTYRVRKGQRPQVITRMS